MFELLLAVSETKKYKVEIPQEFYTMCWPFFFKVALIMGAVLLLIGIIEIERDNIKRGIDHFFDAIVAYFMTPRNKSPRNKNKQNKRQSGERKNRERSDS